MGGGVRDGDGGAHVALEPERPPALVAVAVDEEALGPPARQPAGRQAPDRAAVVQSARHNRVDPIVWRQLAGDPADPQAGRRGCGGAACTSGRWVWCMWCAQRLLRGGGGCSSGLTRVIGLLGLLSYHLPPPLRHVCKLVSSTNHCRQRQT